MGFNVMESLGLKAKKEKASQNEKFLADVGKAQIGATKMFESAHQAMLREAGADSTGIIRGRAGGAVWQGLAGDLGANRIASGDARRQGKFESLAGQALGSALRGATASGTKLQDGVLHAGATSRLSNAQASGSSARSEARMVAAENENKVRLANEWNQQMGELVATAATAGYGQYKAGKAAGAKAGTASGLDGASTGNEGWIYNMGWKQGLGG